MLLLKYRSIPSSDVAHAYIAARVTSIVMCWGRPIFECRSSRDILMRAQSNPNEEPGARFRSFDWSRNREISMTPFRICRALITSPSSHSDRFAHQGIVISIVDCKRMLWRFNCSSVMSLFGTLPTTAGRGGSAETMADMIRRRCGSRECRHVIVHFALAFMGIQPVRFRSTTPCKLRTTRSTEPTSRKPAFDYQ